MELYEFVKLHSGDDPADIVLHRDRWPEVDAVLAAECVAARRKLRYKVPEWVEEERLVFPSSLSAEQCSGTLSARYKASLAAATGARRIADLTGGLGVDCWQFSKVADSVLYNDADTALADAARSNLSVLGCRNVEVSACGISSSTLPPVLDRFSPDLVYIDPSRRDGSGRKVFLPEDCSPDVFELQDIVLDRGCRLLLKLSPMADISLVASRLGALKEVHAVQAGGECKELLFLLEPGFKGDYSVKAVNCGTEPAASFRFLPSEEKGAAPAFISMPPLPGEFIFEPGPALAKCGAFRLVGERFSMSALGPSSHLYVADKPVKALDGLGKWFRVEAARPFGKASMKEFAGKWPDAEVSARSLPLSSDALRKSMGVKGGGSIHVFGVSSAAGRLLIAAGRCSPDLR